jgi:DNA polymerase-3 subunit chi
LAEVLFYRLSGSPAEAALADLLERSLARGWRVLVRVGDAAGLAYLDERLWSWRDEAFLPHGVVGAANADRQPVLLTRDRDNPNAAQVLMLVMGARSDVDEMAGFERVCLMFEETDAVAVETARADWRAVVAAKLPAKYWAQEDGRWVQKAAS